MSPWRLPLVHERPIASFPLARLSFAGTLITGRPRHAHQQQLIMLSSTQNQTISLGIATMQGENSTDFGLIMAGSALASVPIIIVFIIFQKYFTKGITMGAVKG